MRRYKISTYHGHRINMGTPYFISEIHNTMKAVAERINKIATDAAINDYSKKRKTDKQPSFIINSFTYDIKSEGENKVVGTVQCGDEKAYYAIWVDQGHTFRNNKGSFPGYQFMLKGHDAAMDVMTHVIFEEFKKAGFFTHSAQL